MSEPDPPRSKPAAFSFSSLVPSSRPLKRAVLTPIERPKDRKLAGCRATPKENRFSPYSRSRPVVSPQVVVSGIPVTAARVQLSPTAPMGLIGSTKCTPPS